MLDARAISLENQSSSGLDSGDHDYVGPRGTNAAFTPRRRYHRSCRGNREDSKGPGAMDQHRITDSEQEDHMEQPEPLSRRECPTRCPMLTCPQTSPLRRLTRSLWNTAGSPCRARWATHVSGGGGRQLTIEPLGTLSLLTAALQEQGIKIVLLPSAAFAATANATLASAPMQALGSHASINDDRELHMLRA